MCGYTCCLFGAAYEDAQCIDGYMWDLDSYEDGLLTSGGDTPCPACNTALSVSGTLERLCEDIPNPGDRTPAEIWESYVRVVLPLAPRAAAAAVRAAGRVEMLDRPGRVASPEREDPSLAEDGITGLVFRPWPWPVAGLSRHQRLQIEAGPD